MKPHRVYTLFRNLTFALFLTLLLTIFGGANSVVCLVLFLSYVAAVTLALVFPLRQDEPLEGPAKVFFGFFGGMGLLVMMGFMLMIGLLCADAVTSKAEEHVYATYSELASQRIASALHVEAMIPPESKDIHFKGFGGGVIMGWGRYAEFSCKTTEADFIKFAASRACVLETNRFVNANKTLNPNGEPQETCWNSDPLPERFLSHTFIRANGGGIRLMFDPQTATLRGSYSSN